MKSLHPLLIKSWRSLAKWPSLIERRTDANSISGQLPPTSATCKCRKRVRAFPLQHPRIAHSFCEEPPCWSVRCCANLQESNRLILKFRLFIVWSNFIEAHTLESIVWTPQSSHSSFPLHETSSVRRCLVSRENLPNDQSGDDFKKEFKKVSFQLQAAIYRALG